MANENIKIIELPPIPTALTGSEWSILTNGTTTYRFRLSDLNGIINLPTRVTLGITNVDNTSDLDKPISNATNAALSSLGNAITSVSMALSAKANIDHNHVVADITDYEKPTVHYVVGDW